MSMKVTFASLTTSPFTEHSPRALPIFPRIFVKRASWVPIGTVSFTVYFHADGATLAAMGNQHLLAHARAQQFRNGYFDQSAELWGPGGELLAVTHQIVYYKE